MSVQKVGNVIYIWNDVQEDRLENSDPGTPTRAKIREISGDLKRAAERLAPEGRARADQFVTIKHSHYIAPGYRRVFGVYQQAVGNRAPHGPWVHEGTLDRGRFPVVNSGQWMGPVYKGGGIGQVGLTGGPPASTIRQSRSGSARWRAYPSFFYFERYMWRGQEANPWLAKAGGAAYALPGNH